MARCDELAHHSEEPDRLTRRYGTPALRAAQEAVAGWLRAAGMTTQRDALGNVIARYEGKAAGTPAFLLGSHLDTVRDAGKYDGPLGVLVALAAVEALHDRRERLPFALEIVAFADEEGLRFRTAYLGSRAYAGGFDPAWLDLVDDDGVSLRAAIRGFGGDPDALPSARRDGAGLLGYLEVHIEQGPTLEALGLPVGVVSAIAGQGRIAVTVRGEAGHAGTVAMDHRRDALCAAAELVLAVEAVGRATPGLVATVGQIMVEPGAGNVVPGLARLSLDVRHPDDAVREDADRRLRQRADAIAAARRVELAWDPMSDNAATPLDTDLTDLLARAVADSGYPVHRLPSGAGHDAVALSPIAPAAMLFVRCAGGISHNPAESVAVEDVAVAISVLRRFLDLVASA